MHTHVDSAVLAVFSVTVVAPWAVLIFVVDHAPHCPAAADEAAVLYNPVLHAVLVLAYAGPPWFTLADLAQRAAANLGGYDALRHTRLQWIIVSRLLPVWFWLYAFLYNYRHDDVAVFVAFLMFIETCLEVKLVGCGSRRGAVAATVQMGAAIGLIAISAEDARLCGERLL